MDKISVESPGSKSAKTKTDTKKQIFCNRPLNMRNVNAVGFDMDYTLAQYKPETFESLTYKHTVRKLVHNLKYPVEVCPVNLVLILPYLILFFLMLVMIEAVLYLFNLCSSTLSRDDIGYINQTTSKYSVMNNV